MSKYGFLNSYASTGVGVKIGRSKFNISRDHKTTFSSGYWFPIHCLEVLPGDTFSVNLRQLVRLLTPVTPTMDNLIMEVAAFWVPMRLCLNGEHDWEDICVGSEPSAWTNGFDKNLISTNNYVNLLSSFGGVESMSLGNYLGLPIKHGEGYPPIYQLSVAPFNAFIRIWNEWLRDENYSESVDFLNSSSPGSAIEQIVGKPMNDIYCPFKAYKLKDYFTSALPAPQKGGAVLVPIAGEAPVVTGTPHPSSGKSFIMTDTLSNSTPASKVSLIAGASTGVVVGVTETGSPSTGSLVPSNLWADLAASTGASVNAIRMAFALQRLQEKLARGGSRYNEFLKSVFGVSAPTGLLNMSEYLGGGSIPINITQVLQTSSSDDVSPLGSTGAFSNTYDGSIKFTKSFVEYGYVMIVATVRPVQSYSQGIPLMFRRFSPLDMYSPTFAFIGEQPIYSEEIYYCGANLRFSIKGEVTEPNVFGYKEAWSEYKNPYTQISGNFAPDAGDNTLMPWTYTTNFDSSTPSVASESFMQQSSSQIGQTLIDTTTVTQFIGDFVADITAVRPMPAVSIPGFIDHF